MMRSRQISLLLVAGLLLGGTAFAQQDQQSESTTPPVQADQQGQPVTPPVEADQQSQPTTQAVQADQSMMAPDHPCHDLMMQHGMMPGQMMGEGAHQGADGQGMQAMQAEMRALREEVARLRADLQAQRQ